MNLGHGIPSHPLNHAIKKKKKDKKQLQKNAYKLSKKETIPHKLNLDGGRGWGWGVEEADIKPASSLHIVKNTKTEEV